MTRRARGSVDIQGRFWTEFRVCPRCMQRTRHTVSKSTRECKGCLHVYPNHDRNTEALERMRAAKKRLVRSGNRPPRSRQ